MVFGEPGVSFSQDTPFTREDILLQQAIGNFCLAPGPNLAPRPDNQGQRLAPFNGGLLMITARIKVISTLEQRPVIAARNTFICCLEQRPAIAARNTLVGFVEQRPAIVARDTIIYIPLPQELYALVAESLWSRRRL